METSKIEFGNFTLPNGKLVVATVHISSWIPQLNSPLTHSLKNYLGV